MENTRVNLNPLWGTCCCTSKGFPSPARGVTAPAPAGRPERAPVRMSSQPSVHWLRGGEVAWNWPSGMFHHEIWKCYQSGLFFPPLFISPSGESIVKHKHNIGFSFNPIRNAGNNVCWWHLLSFKSGSSRHFRKTFSVWWYYSRTVNVKIHRKVNVFWVVNIPWVTTGVIFFAEVKIIYKDLQIISYTHW